MKLYVPGRTGSHGQSHCVSPAQARPQPRRISQDGTEGKRISPLRLLHDPVMLGQRLHYSPVAFRRDAVSPGTAAPADDDPVTPAVGVACDACHGPGTKQKSWCHIVFFSRLNKRGYYLIHVHQFKNPWLNVGPKGTRATWATVYIIKAKIVPKYCFIM
jgi:hypothetical protein